MTAEFDWWLLIVGLVVGAGLAWLILAELPRRDQDVDASELPAEAAWIAATLTAGGYAIDEADVAAVLGQHRAYLKLPPPDEVADPAAEAPRLAAASPPLDQPGLPAGSSPGEPVAPAGAPPDEPVAGT